MTTVWLPIGKFARQRGISIPTARRWADAGIIQVSYTLGGHRRFPETDHPLSAWQVATRPPMSGVAQTTTDSEGRSPIRNRPPKAGVAATSPSSLQLKSWWPGPRPPAHHVRHPVTALIQHIEELRTSGRPVSIARVDETGRQHVTTISAWLFSLEWVKQNLGGGHFVANGVEFAIEGPPRHPRLR
jgi:hypothetical protein